MTFPISTTDLEKYLPHRLPMRWVNEVLAADESSGTCKVVFDLNAHYCDSVGNIRPSAFIEWMAQSYGYSKAACVHLGIMAPQAIPKRTFLAQMRHATFSLSSVAQHYTVETMCLKVLGPLSLVRGSVKNPDGAVVATADLKLFAE